MQCRAFTYIWTSCFLWDTTSCKERGAPPGTPPFCGKTGDCAGLHNDIDIIAKNKKIPGKPLPGMGKSGIISIT